MRTKKAIIFIVFTIVILFMSSSNVYANIYPLKTALLASIIRLSIYIIFLIYIISSIIFLKKSSKTKSEKIKKILIWLVIVSLVCFVLFCLESYIYSTIYYSNGIPIVR